MQNEKTRHEIQPECVRHFDHLVYVSSVLTFLQGPCFAGFVELYLVARPGAQRRH
jgi:hypothetical protein